MIKKWLIGLINKWSGIKKEYSDKFQIRKITLVDGTVKYYAEYKEDSLDTWNQLIILQTGTIDLKSLDQQNLVNSTMYHYESETLANAVIKSYKAQLLLDRAKDFSSEEIIKVD